MNKLYVLKRRRKFRSSTHSCWGYLCKGVRGYTWSSRQPGVHDPIIKTQSEWLEFKEVYAQQGRFDYKLIEVQ